MLAFIDESGDTGRKITQGSSSHFCVGMVLFEDNDEAIACDNRIELLKRELGKNLGFEFHFKHNSNRIRERFLNAVMPYSFTYFVVAINKDPEKLYGDGFNDKSSFYKYACNMVFTIAKPYLNNTIVLLDKSGNSTFRSQLASYLKKKINDNGEKKIKKVKQQHSHSNNLLQLADYIVGIINRKIQGKKDFENTYKYIKTKEIWVQEWPK